MKSFAIVHISILFHIQLSNPNKIINMTIFYKPHKYTIFLGDNSSWCYFLSINSKKTTKKLFILTFSCIFKIFSHRFSYIFLHWLYKKTTIDFLWVETFTSASVGLLSVYCNTTVWIPLSPLNSNRTHRVIIRAELPPHPTSQREIMHGIPTCC